jgi:hypothetical protein
MYDVSITAIEPLPDGGEENFGRGSGWTFGQVMTFLNKVFNNNCNFPEEVEKFFSSEKNQKEGSSVFRYFIYMPFNLKTEIRITYVRN